MRPSITRALTAALATAGAAGAIIMPTLTLGEPESLPHAFAIPAPRGDVVIQASPVPESPSAHPARPASRTAALRPAPSPQLVVVAPSRRSAPVGRAPSAPTLVRVAAPTPLPTIAPARVPAPDSQPAPAIAAPVVRTVASVAPQPSEPAEAAPNKHKEHKKKLHNEKRKHGKADKGDTTAAATEEAPPAIAEVVPVEPLTDEDAEPRDDDDSRKEHDGQEKEHGGHGKGHSKKK